MNEITEEKAEENFERMRAALENIKELEAVHNRISEEYKTAYEYMAQKKAEYEAAQYHVAMARNNMMNLSINSLYELSGLSAPLHYETDTVMPLKKTTKQ